MQLLFANLCALASLREIVCFLTASFAVRQTISPLPGVKGLRVLFSLRRRREEIMSCQRVFLNRVIAWVALPSLTLFLAVVPAIAQTSNSDYILLVGSGFLCDSGDSSACPAVVKSADGASYETERRRHASLRKASRSRRRERLPASPPMETSLQTGIWMASELVSFDSYGIAPDALMREGWAFGPAGFGPRRMPMLSGSMPAGGLAVLRIRLLPMWGPSRNAALQVNCALGKVPDEHQAEGIRLTFEGGGSEFDQEISGRAMFLLTRPGASPAAEAAGSGGRHQTLRPLRSSSDLNMWGTKLKPTETGQGGTTPIPSAPEIHSDSDQSQICCGKPMAPQLRHARDQNGQMMFVAVCRCPT